MNIKSSLERDVHGAMMYVLLVQALVILGTSCQVTDTFSKAKFFQYFEEV